MKKIFAAAAVSLTLSGCGSTIDPTGDVTAGLTGATILGGLFSQQTDNEYAQALGIILGANLGQAANRSVSGGCIRTGTGSPAFRGGHVFYNPVYGYIQCPPANSAISQVINKLYIDPNWTPVRPNVNQTRNGGLVLRGFR